MSSHVRRVLIADEHDLVRRGLKALLDGRPTLQVVAEAANGRAALEEARATKPNIVIVDYALPDLHGLELTHALKCEIPKVEVLIFTRHDSEDVALNVLRAGAKGYVRKSDPEHHLLAAVDALSLGRPYFSGVSDRVLEQLLESSQVGSPTLTRREREVVQLVAQGQITKDVARTLDIGVKTVETHRSAIMGKLKIHNTAQLVRWALRNNLVEA